MANFTILNRQQFDAVIQALNNADNINKDVVYQIYQTANEGMQGLIESGIFPRLGNVNPFEIVYYCVGEYAYTNQGKTEEEKAFKDYV